MSTQALDPFAGGKDGFPVYLRDLTTWAAASKEHNSVQYLLARNPGGHVTDAKKKAQLAFSTDREAKQLAKDCPGHAIRHQTRPRPSLMSHEEHLPARSVPHGGLQRSDP